MIDYFFQFPTQAAAIADAAGTQYYVQPYTDPLLGPQPGHWFLQEVVPNLQVWQASQDVITYDVIGGSIASGGSGGTNGAVTLTAVGGTGTPATATGVISGGALTSLTAISNPGSYSVLPANPVAVTGGGLTGASVNLQTQQIVTHTYLTGWYGCISLPGSYPNGVPALINHPNLAVAIDRDLSAAGQVAILKNNLSQSLLQDIRFSPLFAGSNYPFGNLK